MKITSMSVRRLRISAEPWYCGNPIPPGEPAFWEYPLLCLRTDGGIEGYAMGYGTNGEGRANACLLHDVYRDVLLGMNSLHSEEIWQRLRRLHRHLYLQSDAIWGQIDVALWDIRGKAANLPIAALLGICRTSVPSYHTGSYFVHTPELIYNEAQRIRDAGYIGAKFNFYDGPAKDVPRLRAAREAVGNDFPLMLDGSSFYSFTDALAVGHELDRLNYLWFEEPVYDRQIGVLKELARQLKTPILATETLSLAETTEFLREGAVDLLRGDVMLKAGVTGLRKLCGAAELFGLNVEIHTCTSPLLDVANLHVLCSIGNSRFLESHHSMFRFGMKGRPLDIDAAGLVHLPSGPGLGVELDWDWIDNHTVEEAK